MTVGGGTLTSPFEALALSRGPTPRTPSCSQSPLQSVQDCLEPFDFGLLPADEYIITSGALKGQRGFFTRDDSGAVVGVDLAGRLFRRLGAGR